jgi:HEAT repeats
LSAALQLEAIGPRGIDTLLEGLESNDLQVRFLAAEALAYQDKHQAVKVLQEAAETESAFRWQALAALSTITHVSALDALDSLLHVASAETRYGAFRALKKRNENSPIFGAETLGENGTFVLHTVPSNGSPMIHYTRSKEPEIVLFGDPIEMRLPEFLDGGKEFLIKVADDGAQIKVCRFTPGKEDRIIICSPRAKDFIHALVQVGASYGLIVQLLDQAKRDDLLMCRLVADATPKANRDYVRPSEEAEEVVAPAPTSLMPIPNMFQSRQPTRSRLGDEDWDSASGTEETRQEKPSWFGRIDSWLRDGM